MNMNIIIPTRIAHYTADEIAETLPVQSETGRRLWEISNAACANGTQTPSGGDGTDGTVETPGDRIGDFGDQGQALWDQLNSDERWDVLVSYDLEYPE